MARFEEIYDRFMGCRLSASEAAEWLGVSERTFRRQRMRFEEEGLEGLLDRRLGRPSPHRFHECVQNAVDQATVAAKTICNKPEPYHAVPWFWSNQYDARLQVSGLSWGHDETVVRGDPTDGQFSVFYLRDGAIIAVDAVNSPREYMMGKRLVAAGAQPAREHIADPSVPVKELAG